MPEEGVADEEPDALLDCDVVLQAETVAEDDAHGDTLRERRDEGERVAVAEKVPDTEDSPLVDIVAEGNVEDDDDRDTESVAGTEAVPHTLLEAVREGESEVLALADAHTDGPALRVGTDDGERDTLLVCVGVMSTSAHAPKVEGAGAKPRNSDPAGGVDTNVHATVPEV